jgi:hypothetical protein
MVFTDTDVMPHIESSRRHSFEYLTEAERFLREEKGDINKAVSRMRALEWEPRTEPKQPEKPYMLNTMARFKHIWERMNEKRDR